MRRLLMFGAGLATGYVLGARAGRERYEQIRRTTMQAWQGAGLDRSARRVGAHAGETARVAAQGAGEWVADGAVTVIDAAKGKVESLADHGPGTRPGSGAAVG